MGSYRVDNEGTRSCISMQIKEVPHVLINNGSLSFLDFQLKALPFDCSIVAKPLDGTLLVTVTEINHETSTG